MQVAVPGADDDEYRSTGAGLATIKSHLVLQMLSMRLSTSMVGLLLLFLAVVVLGSLKREGAENQASKPAWKCLTEEQKAGCCVGHGPPGSAAAVPLATCAESWKKGSYLDGSQTYPCKQAVDYVKGFSRDSLDMYTVFAKPYTLCDTKGQPYAILPGGDGSAPKWKTTAGTSNARW